MNNDSSPVTFGSGDRVTDRMAAAVAADGRMVEEIAAAAGLSVVDLESALTGRTDPLVHDVVLLAITLGCEPSEWFRRAACVPVGGKEARRVAAHLVHMADLIDGGDR